MRDQTLCDAYLVLFGKDPHPVLNNWQIAAMVMEAFDLPVMGKELAKKCILVICNHLKSTSEAEQDVVEMALHSGRHFWPQIPFEVLLSHMPALEETETSV